MKTKFLLIPVFSLILSASGLEMPGAKVTLKVVGEAGEPLANMRVGVVFETQDEATLKGVTDANGVFSAVHASGALIHIRAEGEGYYPTHLRYEFTDVKDGKLVPYNPTVKVLLKRIGSPVPMYARKLEIKVPKEGEPLGLDLEKADWVAPYGKGVEKDFIVTFQRQVRGERDFEASAVVTFSHQGDGIQVFETDGDGSELRLPHTAPESGYLAEWKSERVKKPDDYKSYTEPAKRNFFFRVRTVMQDGRIVRALYGKIHGDIRVDSILAQKSTLTIRYYLNPDGTRNVEFDPERNLFKGLRGFDSVLRP